MVRGEPHRRLIVIVEIVHQEVGRNVDVRPAVPSRCFKESKKGSKRDVNFGGRRIGRFVPSLPKQLGTEHPGTRDPSGSPFAIGHRRVRVDAEQVKRGREDVFR